MQELRGNSTLGSCPPFFDTMTMEDGRVLAASLDQLEKFHKHTLGKATCCGSDGAPARWGRIV